MRRRRVSSRGTFHRRSQSHEDNHTQRRGEKEPREDRQRRSHHHLPRPELRHAQAHHRRRRPRPRRCHAQRAGARGRGVPHRTRRARAPRARRAPHRRHVALPLQGRLLAARARHDDGDLRRRHRALGHPGQGPRRARLSAPRRARAIMSWSTATPTATTSRTPSARSPRTSPRVTRRCGLNRACPGWRTPTAWRRAPRRTSRRRRPEKVSAPRDRVELREVPRPRAAPLRAAAPRARAGDPAPPRRPSPADADRGGAARQGARALPPLLDGGPRSGGAPGGLPLDPPPYDDAPRRRRSLLLDPRLPGAHSGAAHRLHPHERGPRGRHQPPTEDCPPRRALSRADRVPRGDRSEPRVHGGGPPLRPRRPQLRHPGVHAPHRRDRPRLPARVLVLRRRSLPRRRPGPRGRHRREVARSHPYEPAYLPVNRKLDGTLHSW